MKRSEAPPIKGQKYLPSEKVQYTPAQSNIHKPYWHSRRYMRAYHSHTIQELKQQKIYKPWRIILYIS
jgi:hypothetical protein